MSATLFLEYREALERLQRSPPGGVEHAAWVRALDDAALFLANKGHIAARLGWMVEDLFAAPICGRPGGLIWRIAGGEVTYVTSDDATIVRSPTSVSIVRRLSRPRRETPEVSRELATVFANFYEE
jgi:hypothetical protein